MGKNNQNSAENKAEQSEQPQHEVADLGVDHKIKLVNVRQACLSLAHSAGKSVVEVLRDAAVYTNWVISGEIPKEKETTQD